MAELWAIREALIQAWNKGHRYVYLQTDSLLATNWLKDNNTDCPLEFTKSILDCRWLLARPWSWTVHIGHVWREANQCADRLAKREHHKTKEKFYMTHALLFCCNVFTGIPWVLFHPVWFLQVFSCCFCSVLCCSVMCSCNFSFFFYQSCVSALLCCKTLLMCSCLSFQ